MKDYAAIATQYARDVVDGRLIACKWVRLAAARHLKDLERAASGWRYAFNPEITSPDETDDNGQVVRTGKVYRPGDRACHFIELLPHIKGEWAANRENILLRPWQVFVVCSIFGWIDVESRRRRFRVADLFVPRKNAKSTIAAGIGLYCLTADFEFGAEVYSGATSEDQAHEVFRPARLMVERTPDLQARFGVTPRASNISVAATNSKFEPVIGRPGDGASPSCAIVDEYHEHTTEALYDTMRTGMLARAQPLMLVITTAGDDISGPCFAHQESLQQVLEGVIEDERRFGIIYTVDAEDDWTSAEALAKANPNLGVSVDDEELVALQAEAIRDPRKQATFQTKHLNMWVQSANPWLNLHAFRELADPGLKLEDFAGEPCWVGMDLANTTDIASVCLLFRRQIDGENHFYAFWRHYLPEARIAEPDAKHYQGWARAGLLIQTPGNMIDHEMIQKDVAGAAENPERACDATRFRIVEVALDAWGAPGIIAGLQNDGLTVVQVPMQVRHLSAPMKFIDGLVGSKRLHFDGDPVAIWGVSNVQVKPDHNDNWFPRRGNRTKKIDPAVALLVSMCRALAGAPKTPEYQVFVL